MHDVVIVGGGPAGLAAARHLENSGVSVALLEETDRLGGRALTVDLEGEHVNLGAMFVYRDTPAHELGEELGVPMVPFRPDSFGIHLDDTTVVTRDDTALVEHLPLPPESKEALAEFFAQARREYQDNTVGGQLSSRAAELAEITADSRLEGLPADVREILVAGIRGGSVAQPSDLSATYALRYFASYLMREKNNRMVAVEGMESIPAALARSLTTTEVRTGCSVTSVRPVAAGCWEVTAEAAGSGDGGSGETVTLPARHVVLAVPAPRITELVALPAWKRHALEQIQTPGSTVLGVVADVSDAAIPEVDGVDGGVQVDYDDWSFVITPGRPFDAIINPRPGRGDRLAQFVCFGNGARYLPEANQEGSGILDDWVEHFLAVAPGLRGRIVGARIRSWEHCFSLLTPARDAALPEIQAPVEGTLHFAGDYSSQTAGTHGAYAEARRVAGDIISQLQAAAQPS